MLAVSQTTQIVSAELMFRFGRFSNDKLLGNEPCVNRLIVVVRAIVPASYKPRPFRVGVIDLHSLHWNMWFTRKLELDLLATARWA